MSEGEANEKKSTKMRLWTPRETIIDHDLSNNDREIIYSELHRKVQSISNNKLFVPDGSKDSLFSSQYAFKDFDIFSVKDRMNIFHTINCQQIRKQSFFLLEYTREERKIISELIKKANEESDEINLKCIRSIIQQKKRNLAHIESIRGFLSEIVCIGEEAASHVDRCFKMLNK